MSKSGPNARPLYKTLRKMEARDEPCAVPACRDGRVTDDCCYRHSLNKSSPTAVPNDGIIDWVAVEVAVQGARKVSLTWVEANIAAAVILTQGGTVHEIGGRLHLYLKAGSERLAEVRLIAADIIENGLPGSLGASFSLGELADDCA